MDRRKEAYEYPTIYIVTLQGIFTHHFLRSSPTLERRRKEKGIKNNKEE